MYLRVISAFQQTLQLLITPKKSYVSSIIATYLIIERINFINLRLSIQKILAVVIIKKKKERKLLFEGYDKICFPQKAELYTKRNLTLSVSLYYKRPCCSLLLFFFLSQKLMYILHLCMAIAFNCIHRIPKLLIIDQHST